MNTTPIRAIVEIKFDCEHDLENDTLRDLIVDAMTNEDNSWHNSFMGGEVAKVRFIDQIHNDDETVTISKRTLTKVRDSGGNRMADLIEHIKKLHDIEVGHTRFTLKKLLEYINEPRR